MSDGGSFILSDDGLFIKEFSVYIQYVTFLLALIFYNKYKDYRFYNFFAIYMFNIILLDVLASIWFQVNNYELFNIYTFFEFNFFVLIYYHLLEQRKNLKFVKILAIVFNLIYIISFYFGRLKLYTVPLEGVFNSVLVIIYFAELLHSEKILNYKKMLPFWISVGFLLFYLTSVPFFTLLSLNMFDTRAMFPIIYYLTALLHLFLIYGLIACRKRKI
jgi:hypothetical protein